MKYYQWIPNLHNLYKRFSFWIFWFISDLRNEFKFCQNQE
jgi:hypothetical protein